MDPQIYSKLNYPVIIIGSGFSFIVNILFFTYILAKTLWLDCNLKSIRYTSSIIKLQERLEPFLRKLSPKFKIQYSPNYTNSVQRKRFLNLNLRMLVYVQIFAILVVFVRFCGLFSDILCAGCIPCKIQAIALHWTLWCQNLWFGVISTWLFVSLVFTRQVKKLASSSLLLLEILFHLFVYIISTVLTLLPMTTDAFDRTPLWCWIDRKKWLGGEWIIASFFAPVWLLTLAKKSIVQELKRDKKLFQNDHKVRMIETEVKAYSKLFLLPLVFMFLWVIPTINRIVLNIMFQIDSQALLLVQLFQHTFLDGSFNALIYFINPIQNYLLIKKVFCCDFCKRKKRKETDEIHEFEMKSLQKQNHILNDFTSAPDLDETIGEPVQPYEEFQPQRTEEK